MAQSRSDFPIPREPIHRFTEPLQRFMHVEAAGGGVLIACTAVAMILANSPLSDAYLGFWKTPVQLGFGSFVMEHKLQHWINDGLMAIFFFVVGLEVKREMVLGELRELRTAALPIAAAVGGMVLPAGIYLWLQAGQVGEDGWGIPMATDIAFVVGCMAVLGRRVPHALRIMVLSLAIVDDIGAIFVIAFGYSKGLSLVALALGGLGLLGIRGLAVLGVRSFLVYTVAGAGVWFAFHESGVHATIAGVILGLMTPANRRIETTAFSEALERVRDVMKGDWDADDRRAERMSQFRHASRETLSPLEVLEYRLHPWVGFLIMPVFALANAGVVFYPRYLTNEVALAIAAGLILGKPLGVFGASYLAVRLGIASKPASVGWGGILAGGMLAGIGFTMSLFIAGLALPEELLYPSKVGILLASAFAAVVGLVLMIAVFPAPGAAPRRGG